jgi:2-dehydro-3-deoxyglucarate aldolase/4-hydroxy-2-oxoheptanedioate aldolase
MTDTMHTTVAGDLRIGTWLSLGSPVAAELAALCGLAWVLLDLEHGSGSEADLLAQLVSLRGSGTLGVVRVAGLDAAQIGRVLDQGAHGVMVPHVNSAAEAREIVMAAAYPPRGRRGFSRTVRAHDYGLRSFDTTPPPLLVAQIETAAAVAEAGAIAEVGGIDVLFVGPADLERDLAGQPAGNVPDFETCVARVATAARAAGKAAGILVRNPAELPLRQRQGFSLIAVQSDVALLRDAFRAIVAAAQAR